MLPTWLVVSAGSLAMLLLFLVAAWADRRCRRGRSVIANPYLYALSLTIYITAWGFFGNVGLAAREGPDFIALHIGPTLMAVLGWHVLRKIIRISKRERLTSIADFISARYGKSTALGVLATLVALIGVTPYIALQLDAISSSFRLITGGSAEAPVDASVLADTGLHVAVLLAVFTILFGTRSLDAAERHEGMVAAIAVEAVFKLMAFLAVGVFVCFVLFDGLPDLYRQAASLPQAAELFMLTDLEDHYRWFWFLLLSMLAVFMLPRMFHMAVVENVDERHLRKALWLFPLYMLVMDLFILPIAMAGLLRLGPAQDPDTYVLALGLAADAPLIGLVGFLGGLLAATAMVIAETIALSTMACNNLVMPLLLRIRALRLQQRADLSGLLLAIRRGAIVAALLFGYAFSHASARPLAETGLISFAAVAQFAPAILGGIFWKRGSRLGALAGLGAGTALVAYCLAVPSFADAGWLDPQLVTQGPFGIEWLRPTALFGMTALSPIPHGVFWSLLINLACYVGISLFARQTVLERSQAEAFVDVFQPEAPRGQAARWHTRARVSDLYALLTRTLGSTQADRVLPRGGAPDSRPASPELVQQVETVLAGAVGSASAHIMLAPIAQQDPLRDAVTGLPNEAALLAELSQALARTEPPAPGFALLLIDLNRYRIVAHSLGAAAAETLLTTVAARLSSARQPTDVVASLGGDQFALLLRGVSDAAVALQIAQRVQMELNTGVRVNGDEVYPTASVGIALPAAGDDAATLLSNAELAMRSTRARGVGGRAIYHPSMRAGARARVRLDSALRRGLEQHRFVLHYQPIVSLATGELRGFEALVRWRNEADELVPPADFLPLCEETDLIFALSNWVTSEACRQMADWCARHPAREDLAVSVNLSVRQLSQPDLPERICEALERAHLPPRRLKLEITESVLISDPQHTRSTLGKLRDREVELSIDDFGTGYSSLSYLHLLPVNALKIDKSFIAAMERDPMQAEIVETTVVLARRLGLHTVAEGITSAAQVRHLRRLGTEFGQGFYFARPLSAAAAEALVARRAQWAVA